MIEFIRPKSQTVACRYGQKVASIRVHRRIYLCRQCLSSGRRLGSRASFLGLLMVYSGRKALILRGIVQDMLSRSFARLHKIHWSSTGRERWFLIPSWALFHVCLAKLQPHSLDTRCRAATGIPIFLKGGLRLSQTFAGSVSWFRPRWYN